MNKSTTPFLTEKQKSEKHIETRDKVRKLSDENIQTKPAYVTR